MKHLTILLAFIPMLSCAQSKDELFLRDTAIIAKEMQELKNARCSDERIGDFTITHFPYVQRMIQIINKYGYPSRTRYGFRGNAEAIILLTPRIFGDTILSLLDAEKKAGRIGHYEYAYFYWRLDRTVVLPTLSSISAIKTKRKRSDTTIFIGGYQSY